MEHDGTCMDEWRDENVNCGGELGWHRSLGGTMSIFRCDNHQMAMLKVGDEINSRYPDTPMAPDWFDPMDAGEHWDYDY